MIFRHIILAQFLSNFPAPRNKSPSKERALAHAQPRGKLANWGNAFPLGPFAGTHVNIHDMTPERVLDDLKNPHLPPAEQRRQVELLDRLNRLELERQPQDARLEGSI